MTLTHLTLITHSTLITCQHQFLWYLFQSYVIPGNAPFFWAWYLLPLPGQLSLLRQRSKRCMSPTSFWLRKNSVQIPYHVNTFKFASVHTHVKNNKQNNKQNKKIVFTESNFELSLLTSNDSGDDEDNLISKPEGKASQPGCSGYNLKDALSWPGKDYQRLHYFMVLMILSNFSLSPTEICQEACSWATWDRQELFFPISCLYCIYSISGMCFNTLIW